MPDVAYLYPFLYINDFKIKPSCFILLFFMICLFLRRERRRKPAAKADAQKTRKRPEYTYVFCKPSTLWAEHAGRRTVIGLLGLYLMFYLLYWLQPSMGICDGETHWLIALAEAILQYETAVSVVLLILFAGAGAIRSNKHQYLRTLDRTVDAAVLLYTCCTQIARQIPPDWGAVDLPLLFLISVGLETCRVQSSAVVCDAAGGFLPVNSYEKLFSARRRQADQLVDLIQNSPPQALSICISGDWGSGKTSLVNGALGNLMEKCPHQYEAIRINVLELDTLQSLRSYIFRRIRRCLKARGVYVGIGSEYQKFFTAAMGSISTPSLAETVWSYLFPPASDYREERQRLESVLADALGEQGRMIIVVDDIERCGEKKAQEFVFFLKEVATMSHCVTLFLTDEKQLHMASRQIDGSDPDKDGGYLFYEKFFNYRIEVEAVSAYDAMREYEYGRPGWDRLSSKLKSPAEVYRKIEVQLSAKREDLEQKVQGMLPEQVDDLLEGELLRLQESCSSLQEYLSNPRHLVKLYYTLERYGNVLLSEFDLQRSDGRQWELDAYFQKLKLDELLFYLAFLEVCFPAEAKLLKSRGRAYFEGFQPKERPAILAELGDPLLFELSDFSRNVQLDYLQNERLAFIDAFYRDRSQLPRLVSRYTTQEEEWFHALDCGEAASLAPVWDQVLNAVFRKFAFRNQMEPDEEASRKLAMGQGYVRQLFQLAAERLRSQQWTPDEVLSFMDPACNNAHYLSQDLAVMEDLCSLCGEFFVPSRKLHDRLTNFSVDHVEYRMRSVTRLLYYIAAAEGEERARDMALLKKIEEKMLFSVLPIPQRIDAYLSDLSKLTFPPDCGNGEREDAFARLEHLADHLKNWLDGNDLLRFDDVRQSLTLMRVSIQDMRCFSELLIRLEPADPGHRLGNISSLNGTQVYEALMRFQELFLERPSEFDSSEQIRFQMLFDRIRSDPGVCLTQEQIEDLQQLLVTFHKQLQRPPIMYRKALLDGANRLKKRSGEAGGEG